MTPEQKRLLDRITKLLALAGSTTFSAEAQTAREMADKLMAEHKIVVGEKPGQDTIELRMYTPFAKGARWEGMIVCALANVCSCEVFFQTETLTFYKLVGTIWNLDCLQYMLGEVNRQRIDAWLQYKGRQGPDSFHKFCYGFAKALEDKCNRIVNMPVLAKTKNMLILWYETTVLHHKVSYAELTLGRAGSDAGVSAGSGASLHRGALGTPQKRLT